MANASEKQRARWRSPTLGAEGVLDLPGGRVAYFETGAGPTLVFAHGLLVNANLWRGVIEPLSASHRCIALDLPLGSHRVPAGPKADLTPSGVAALVVQALEAFELDDVTLVGNDTGGALAQIVVTTYPERVGRLVLTSCDSRDTFPPALFKPLKIVARTPGATQAILSGLAKVRVLRRTPLAFGWLAKRPIDDDAGDSYVLPSLVDPEIRRDLRRFLPTLDPSYTREAAERLPSFDRPTLIAWSQDEKLFPHADADALAALLPNARLEWVQDSYTFSPEDNPARLAELIADFVREPAGAVA